MQKLIVNSQAQFLNKTGHGIDLIIIDDFSFMKLDINRKCIINQNSIINEYYNYLKDQSLNILGTGINIPIVITITPSRLISDTYDYDIYDLYKFIPHSLMILSDNVFIINCNDLLKKQNKCVINILKSSNGKILEQPKDINVKYQYYFMEYNKDSNTSTKILLEEKNLENQNLNHELDELKEMINDTSNTTLSEEFNLKLDL